MKKFASANNCAAMPEFIFLLCEGETGRRYLRYLTAAGVVDLSRTLIYLLPLSFGSKRPKPNFCWDVAAVTRCRSKFPPTNVNICRSGANLITHSSGSLRHLCVRRVFCFVFFSLQAGVDVTLDGSWILRVSSLKLCTSVLPNST